MDECLADVAEVRNGLRRIINTYCDAPPLTSHAKALRCAIDASNIKSAERVLARIRWELGSVREAGR
jgi:hypothetical protein